MLKRILDESCLFRYPAGMANGVRAADGSPRLCTVHPINPSRWDAAKLSGNGGVDAATPPLCY